MEKETSKDLGIPKVHESNAEKTAAMQLAFFKERILEEWEAGVRDRVKAHPKDSAALRNSLPNFIDELVKVLESTSSNVINFDKAKLLGRAHGEDRARLESYDLDNMIEEYQVLREVIFSVLRESTTLSPIEQDAILNAITICIRFSIVEFVKYKHELFADLFAKEALAIDMGTRTKNAFLVNMSHEIRTPITGILGFIEVLRDDSLTTEEREDSLARLESSGRALLRVIDDVLDLAKIEAGVLGNQRSRFSIRDIATDVIALISLAAQKKGISLRLEMDVETPPSAYSDPGRIRQILINLLGNAVKFTLTGEVILRVRSESGHALIFDVQDTGIGISASDQEKLFRRFSQAVESISRLFGGTGIGLVLSQRLAEGLGGSLKLVESKPGVGSTFSLRIDAAAFGSEVPVRVLPDEKNKNRNLSLTGLRILLAEDSTDNQVLFTRFLTGAGAEVQLAKNGQEAIEHASLEKFDLILMDIQMPKCDGIQATRYLRSQHYMGPILALSAHAMNEEIKRSIEAGCNTHLTKPISKASLISSILEYARV